MKNFHILPVIKDPPINYSFRIVLRTLLFEISKKDISYLRMYANAKIANLGFEFQDGVTLAKEYLRHFHKYYENPTKNT